MSSSTARRRTRTPSRWTGNATSYAAKNLLDGTTYYFAVSAYDATGVTSDPSTEVSGTTAPAVRPEVTALALSADVASPQVVGTTVTWVSTATGGAAPYQYRWWVYNGNVWSAATAWTTSSTWRLGAGGWELHRRPRGVHVRRVPDRAARDSARARIPIALVQGTAATTRDARYSMRDSMSAAGSRLAQRAVGARPTGFGKTQRSEASSTVC